MKFDIFTIRLWRQGYTLEVKISRPANAPRYKRTKADGKRQLAAIRQNQKLNERLFPTLSEVFEEIGRLQIPANEQAREENEA